jgi:starch-binding outer membrane protein, SusD/RagB family
MENDFHLFRISDFYLMKAEALVRRDNGSSAEATDLVNAIRARAFPNMPSKLFASVTLDDIMMERRFELAWEGFSRQDQIRFGHFGDAVADWKEADPIDLNDNPAWFPGGHTHYDLFPIPQGARNGNPNLMQNPGYSE